MTDELEKRIARALAPVDPPAGFADRVLAALPKEREAIAATPRPRRWWMPASLAASLLAALLVHRQIELHTEARAGLEARQQLLEALRVTSDKLDIAWQAVQEPREAPGAAENPT
jgi:hypothetical protein